MERNNMMVWCTVLSMLFIAFGSQAVFAEELIGETAPMNLSTVHPYAFGSVGETMGTFEVGRQDATFIIVHFTNFSLNDGDYVAIRDGKGNLRQIITNDDPGKTDFWAFAVDGDRAFVDLISGSAGAHAYGFDIDQYGYGFIPLIESICGTDDKVDIECVNGTPQYERAKSVGRMLYQKGTNWYLCTGSLVSQENHFLSNEHCVNSQAIVNTLQVRFNYQYTTCGGSTLASYVTHYGDAFLVSNYSYDCSLMTLSGNPQATFGYLELDPRDMVLNETVYIPQHPGGRPMEYNSNIVNDPVADGYTANSDFGYQVDTEGGSSGSPVLSMTDHKVVGLHHWGLCNGGGGQNQGVLMKKVYPTIEPYLPDSGYDLCFTSDGWTKEFDVVGNFWLVGEGDHPSCGTGPLVGWVYGNKYAFNWDIATPNSCTESIFYFGHVWDLSYYWINTGGVGSGTGTMTPCTTMLPKAEVIEGKERKRAGVFDSEETICLVDNYGQRHTFDFDGYYLVGQTETLSCGTVPLIGAVEGDLFSFYVDVPTGTGSCPEGMILAGFVSTLSGVWRATTGAMGGFSLSPCTSSDVPSTSSGDPLKTQ